MRGISLLIAMLITCTVSAAGEGLNTAELLSSAKKARQQAESSLASARSRILAKRTALFEKVNDLQRQLESERAAGIVAAEKLDAATRRRDRRAEQIEREKRDYERLLNLVAETCGLRGQLPRDDLGAVETRLRGAISARLTRIDYDSRLRTRDLSVADRKGHTGELPVIALGSVQELAAGPTDASVGIVRRDGDAALVAGPMLTPEQRESLRTAARGDVGALPCDVSGTLADQQAVEPWTLRGWLAAGGVFIWPIMLAILLAAGLAIERLVALVHLKASPLDAERIMKDVREGRLDAAKGAVAGGVTPLDRVLRAGLAALGLDRPAREAALEAALLEEQPRFEKSLSLLAALAAIAPLLGLLGTVTGMIGTFEAIAINGTGNPRLLSGGISEALITTQAGLLTAVPILLLHAYIGRVVDQRQSLLEQTAASLLAVGEKRCEEPPAAAGENETGTAPA